MFMFNHRADGHSQTKLNEISSNYIVHDEVLMEMGIDRRFNNNAPISYLV